MYLKSHKSRLQKTKPQFSYIKDGQPHCIHKFLYRKHTGLHNNHLLVISAQVQFTLEFVTYHTHRVPWTILTLS